jgi:hypothetical protein
MNGGNYTEEMRPLNFFAEVTPSDTVNLTRIPRAILVGVAGNVEMHDENGNAATVYLAAGIWHPMRPRRILAAGTAATGIVMGW